MHFQRLWRAVGATLFATSLWLHMPAARAQFSYSPVELSDSVSLDEADSAVRAHLERVKAYLSDRQWDEAVETLRQVMENHGSKMIALVRNRYVNVADYAHVQVASLPPEALDLYRQRVDPLAEQWFDEAIAKRDSARLAEIVDKMFCSSWGDDALLALGEIELEQAHYGAARRAWERLIEVPPARVVAERFEAARRDNDLAADEGALLDKWYTSEEGQQPKLYEMRGGQTMTDADSAALVRIWKRYRLPFQRLAYPNTTIPLSDIRARLIMVSIMEGALDRARGELQSFEVLHPAAEGRLGGRAVKYAEALSKMIEAADQWPALKASDDWPTFAGAPSRNKIATRDLDLGASAWEPISLGEPLAADSINARAYSLRRIGEDSQHLLSYHPIVVGNLLLVNNQSRIFAFDIRTGKPAWNSGDAKRPPGEIFEEASGGVPTRMNRGLGVPRFTMTAHRGKLYARMGSQVTSRPMEGSERAGGTLVCLDLAAQGKIVWSIAAQEKGAPDEEKWAFEGSPIVDGANVYIAMRKSDVRPQAHVACFHAQTGARRWRTMICAAETPGGGQAEEITHNLLTFEQGMLYYNTNLGAVTALSASDGRLQWLTRYARAKKARPDGQDKRTAHFYRDLNPCIYYRGMLLVAPSDCESIFALDAGSGELVWESQLPEDAIHLLGVGHGNLLASGDRLWWIDAHRGKIVNRWPDTSPIGNGRGVLMGDEVIWPTADKLYVFPQDASKQQTPRDPIPLVELREAAGGNLIPAGDLLVIATPAKLFAFRQQGKEPLAGDARPMSEIGIKRGRPVAKNQPAKDAEDTERVVAKPAP